jgi:predicted transcriptional regulator of viral defense system
MSYMLDKTQKRIQDIFKKHSGYARTIDICSEGIHHTYLRQLVDDGKLIKIRHGLYSLPEIDNHAVLHEALLIIPGGIICVGTALSYHELTTWNPPDIHIGLPRGKKIVLPDYPPIKLFHFTESIFNLGREEIEMGNGRHISIYNKERCVCDAVRFRNKIGIDIMKEVLRGYMNSKNKNINILNQYARKLRISSVINQYQDVLL